MRTDTPTATTATPTVTIRVSGQFFEGHLLYLEQLVRSAAACLLWPLLNLACVQEVDDGALYYLAEGEGRRFSIVSCPDFVREGMQQEIEHVAA